MSYVVHSRKDQLKAEYWENFANDGRRKFSTPKEIDKKLQPIKTICISCLKNEIPFNAYPKKCDDCRTAQGIKPIGMRDGEIKRLTFETLNLRKRHRRWGRK